jgi:hypothetical protein
LPIHTGTQKRAFCRYTWYTKASVIVQRNTVHTWLPWGGPLGGDKHRQKLFTLRYLPSCVQRSPTDQSPA